jgi:hypothetical protein
VNVTVTNPNSSNATLNNAFTFLAVQFDANGDGAIDPADIFYLVNYLFTNGPAPRGAAGLMSGDANGDNVVDPADIFYVINYLFTGGPQPMAAPSDGRLSTNKVASRPLAGSVTLGRGVLRDGRYFVPVIVTVAPGSMEPQALSLRVRAGAEGQHDLISIHRAGAAKDLRPSFEIARASDESASYLVVFDSVLKFGATRSAVVAEIEIDAAASGRITLNVDRTVTMLSDQSGTSAATVQNGALTVRGTTLNLAPRNKPLSPAE